MQKSNCVKRVFTSFATAVILASSMLVTPANPVRAEEGDQVTASPSPTSTASAEAVSTASASPTSDVPNAIISEDDGTVAEAPAAEAAEPSASADVIDVALSATPTTVPSATPSVTPEPTPSAIENIYANDYQLTEDERALDFSSARLIVGADDASDIIDKSVLIDSYKGIYFLQFASTEDAMNAYGYYRQHADFVQPDTLVVSAEGDDVSTDTPVGDTSAGETMTAEDNPIAAFKEEASITEETAEDNSSAVTEIEVPEESASPSASAEPTASAESTASPVASLEPAEATASPEAITEPVNSPESSLQPVDEDQTSASADTSFDVALIDTGVAEGYADKIVSVLGDDGLGVNGHGTEMSLIIHKYAPEARILSIKALNDDGSGNMTSVYAAMELAIQSNVKYINLSLSGLASPDSRLIEEAVADAKAAGITVIGAAGNDGKNAKYFTPGSITDAVIAGACDEEGTKLALSNYGATVDYFVAEGSTSKASATIAGLAIQKGTAEGLVDNSLVFSNTSGDEDSEQEPMGSGTVQAATIASGTWGTCAWNIDDNGVLTIGAGTGADTSNGASASSYDIVEYSADMTYNSDGKASGTATYAISPWHKYASQINRVTTNGTVKLPKNAGALFYGFTNCTSIDLSGFDSSSTDILNEIFENCSSLQNIDVSPLDTSSATSMGGMFQYCTALKAVNLSTFNTSDVIEFSAMFNGCTSLTNVNLTGWKTSNVISMRGMFCNCSALTALDVSKFDTSKVTDMYGMFYHCSALTALDVSNFDTSKVTDMYGMFYHCSALTTLDVSNFNTSKVTNMNRMFYYCSALTTLDVSKFNTSEVTNMYGMFYHCSTLTALDVSNFNTSKVTNMNRMFYNCSALTALDVSKFDTSKVTDMYGMFFNCVALTALDVSKFNTSKVTNMSGMFSNCGRISSLDVGSFDTASVVNMAYMFGYCLSLTSLDVSKFNTANVTDMTGMFKTCQDLASLDVSSFNTSKAAAMKDIFTGCSKLIQLDVSKNFVFNDSSVLPSPTVPSGYTAGGWYTAKTGGIKRANAGEAYTITENETIYYRNLFIYTDYLLLEKGTIKGDSFQLYASTGKTLNHYNHTIEQSHTLSDPTNIPNGYEFKGWQNAEIYSWRTGNNTLNYYDKSQNYDSFAVFAINKSTNKWTRLFSTNSTGQVTQTGTLALASGEYTLKYGKWASGTGGTYAYSGKMTIIEGKTYKYYVHVNVTGISSGDSSNVVTFNDFIFAASSSDPVKNATIAENTASHTAYIAAYAPIDYQISYQLNGGTNSASNPSSYNVASNAITLAAPTRTGYTFTGWTGSNGTTAQASVTIAKGSTGDKSYTANWKANTDTKYTVIHQQEQLDGSYKTIDTQNLTGTTDSKVTPAVKAYTGFTAPAAQTATIAGAGTTTITYKYSRNSYTITRQYRLENADGSFASYQRIDSKSYKYGASVPAWNRAADTIYKAATIAAYTVGAKNDTLSVSVMRNTSTNNIIQYRLQNADGSYPSEYTSGWSGTLRYGESYTWTYNQTASHQAVSKSVSYNAGAAKVDVPRKTGRLVIHANGGNSDRTTTPIIYGSATDRIDPMPTRTGYTLTGLYTAASGGTKVADASGRPANDGTYSKSGAWLLNSDVPVYAQWKANSYTVTYNGNGASSGAMASQTATYNANFITTKNAFAKDGYWFAGWNERADGTGVVWSLGSHGVAEYGQPWVWTYTEDITLYAQWTPYKYTVSFNANGGSGTTASVTATYGSALPSITNGMSRTGYTFAGFYDAATGGTQYYSASNAAVKAWDKAASAALYAHWTLTPYKFDVNPQAHVTGFRLKKNDADADGGKAITDYYADAHMGDKFVVYSPTFANGYTFSGYTNQGGPGAQTVSGTNATVTMGAGAQSIVIDAKPITYSISYSLNGGSITGQKTSYTIESDAFTIPTPAKAGWTFTGWSGTDLLGDANMTVTVTKGSTGNRSYTAHFSKEITLTEKHGTSITTQKYTLKDSETSHAFTLDTSKDTFDRWTFGGWRTDITLGEKQYDPTGSITLSDSATVYASYSRKKTATFVGYAAGKQQTRMVEGIAYSNNPSDSKAITYGTITAPEEGAYADGWTADGWTTSTEADGTAEVKSGGAVAFDADHLADETYYGLYSQTVSLKFDLDGAAGTQAAQTANRSLNSSDVTKLKKAVFHLAAKPTRLGYTFTGWKLNDADETILNAEEEYTADEGTALVATAQWSLNQTLPNTGGSGIAGLAVSAVALGIIGSTMQKKRRMH